MLIADHLTDVDGDASVGHGLHAPRLDGRIDQPPPQHRLDIARVERGVRPFE
jgi:hypothetical protein